jgi:hypothetical protein
MCTQELEAHAPKKETDEKFAFDVAVKGCTRYDVCRTFLATLQLANDGNVEIALEVCNMRVTHTRVCLCVCLSVCTRVSMQKLADAACSKVGCLL